jgi:hypothetical protein
MVTILAEPPRSCKDAADHGGDNSVQSSHVPVAHDHRASFSMEMDARYVSSVGD